MRECGLRPPMLSLSSLSLSLSLSVSLSLSSHHLRTHIHHVGVPGRHGDLGHILQLVRAHAEEEELLIEERGE